MPLDSIAEILASCSERNLAFWQVVLEADVEERQVSAGASFAVSYTHLTLPTTSRV